MSRMVIAKLLPALLVVACQIWMGNALARDPNRDVATSDSSSTDKPRPEEISATVGANIQVFPSEIKLRSRHARQQLHVVRVRDGFAGETVPGVRWTVSDPEIVQVQDSVLLPLQDGTATVTATDGDGKQATLTVEVTGTQAKHQWSFRNDVQSILAKQSCNMGACHGALAGKGGFRLSLRGYDSEADFRSITREARGRRVELADPGRSLILAKPSGVLPHKGGLRLREGDRDFQIIADWIASGAAGPRDDDRRLSHIKVLPELSRLQPGDQTQVLVQAHYDDGSIDDVTHWAKFSATDQSVADVDETGGVTIRGSGQAAVLVWFGSRVVLSKMVVPYDNEIDEAIYAATPRRNFIDSLNLDQLRELNLQPSPRCDDATFLRRASVDATGRLPSIAVREGYWAQAHHLRRDWLVEQLLSSEDYVDYWTYKWSDVLLINGNRLRPAAVKSYYDWLHESIRAGTPWDELAREILTATGDGENNGATHFYALNQTPEDMTENACQAFMGLSIGCAKCHNHPLERWTNDQYYAMANLFSRVRAKGWGGDSRNGDGKRQLYLATSGELVQPNRGRPQRPAPLDGDPLEFDDPGDRREVLADWMVSPENPYFARAITNRVWANFFGRGLVEAVDDLRLSNPATNEALLDAAAKHLIDHRFNLKALMRTILQSETYQRESISLPGNRDENRFLSRYYPRRMMAEVLLDSIDSVLGTRTTFDKIAFSGGDAQKTDVYKAGTRAIELYDSAVDSYFLKTFGRNPREITCECERDDEPSMVQALHLSNGETLNPKLLAENSLPQTAIAESWDDNTYIETLFRTALCREPTEAERTKLLGVLSEYEDDRATALQDLAWSVLTSTEFTFNH